MCGDVFRFVVHLHMLVLSNTATVVFSYCTFLWWKMSAGCHMDFMCVLLVWLHVRSVWCPKGCETWKVRCAVTRRKCLSLFFRSTISPRFPRQHICHYSPADRSSQKDISSQSKCKRSSKYWVSSPVPSRFCVLFLHRLEINISRLNEVKG
jgi:hypothetical protein